MPKIVDHDERRSDVVRAIIKVISENGISGATVRTIAREGGFSSGMITHYFADKDQMVRYAFEFVDAPLLLCRRTDSDFAVEVDALGQLWSDAFEPGWRGRAVPHVPLTQRGTPHPNRNAVTGHIKQP
jgi:AcrR family transcriptional regulator